MFLVEAFLQLIQHPFWSRLWIVPEVYLGQKVELLWEANRIDWLSLRDLIDEIFLNLPHESPPCNCIADYIKRRIPEKPKKQSSDNIPIINFCKSTSTLGGAGLVELMELFEHHLCERLHD